MKTDFINKWKCWWMLQKQGAELTDAFEKELNAIIEQEVANKFFAQAHVSGQGQYCLNCDKKMDEVEVYQCPQCWTVRNCPCH